MCFASASCCQTRTARQQITGCAAGRRPAAAATELFAAPAIRTRNAQCTMQCRVRHSRRLRGAAPGAHGDGCHGMLTRAAAKQPSVWCIHPSACVLPAIQPRRFDCWSAEHKWLLSLAVQSGARILRGCIMTHYARRLLCNQNCTPNSQHPAARLRGTR